MWLNIPGAMRRVAQERRVRRVRDPLRVLGDDGEGDADRLIRATWPASGRSSTSRTRAS
jgi:hypothetical protein